MIVPMSDSGPTELAPALPPRFSPAILAAAGFTALYFVIAMATAIGQNSTEFVFYGLVMILLIALLLAAHLRVRFSAGLIWCMAIWGLLHMAGGLMPVPPDWAQGEGQSAVLYSLWLVPMGVESGWLKYDKLVHAFGFGVMTWLCWQALRSAVAQRTGQQLRPSAGLLLLCVMGSMGFGALNEIIEFLATRLTATNVGGYLNTSLDLVANLVGAAVAAAWLGWSGRASRKQAFRR
jgi:uncharacterized membrane protein YjdF